MSIATNMLFNQVLNNNYKSKNSDHNTYRASNETNEANFTDFVNLGWSAIESNEPKIEDDTTKKKGNLVYW